MEDFINLSIGGVKYEGPASMVQFTVESTKMMLKDSSYLVVEIVLKRRFEYHLAATYVPSALLIIVTTITLFVDEKHYGSTIMVHLTTMLVMFTLYQSVSDSMPKTAYLKFIDIWLLYGIIVPFMTFVVETVLMLLSSNDDIENLNANEIKLIPPWRKIEVVPAFEITKSTEQATSMISCRKKIKAFLQRVAQVTIPLSTVTFFISYSYFAYQHYQ